MAKRQSAELWQYHIEAWRQALNSAVRLAVKQRAEHST